MGPLSTHLSTVPSPRLPTGEMDNTSWSQESGWLKLESLAPGVGGRLHAQPWDLSLGFGELIVPIDLEDLQFFR